MSRGRVANPKGVDQGSGRQATLVNHAASSNNTIVHAEADRYSGLALQIYRSVGTVLCGRPSRTWLRRHLGRADVLVVRLGVAVDREILEWSPRLRIVASPTTGREHIDADACARRGVEILTFAGRTDMLGNVTATAEHAIGLILALLRRTLQAHEHVIKGGWNRNLFVSRELSALTVGVVGLGRLGSRVASYLKCLGATVIACDPLVDDARFDALGVARVSLAELLARSDVISLHASVTSGSRGLIDRSAFERLRPGTLLVNTARGALVDQEAMLEALDNGLLGGVALDVISGEPMVREALRPLVARVARGANIIITPHIAGCTSESLQLAERLIATMVVEALRPTGERDGRCRAF